MLILCALVLAVFGSTPSEARGRSSSGYGRSHCHCERYSNPRYAGERAYGSYRPRVRRSPY